MAVARPDHEGGDRFRLRYRLRQQLRAQIFNSRYAPRYATSFGIAMGFVGAATLMVGITWYVTREVDADTRRLKRARMVAAQRNEAVLDDVDISRGRK